MNINTLSEIIELFNEEIVETGFQRDIQDYISSLPNNQSNIVALRDIADKVSTRLNRIYAGDLPELLKKLYTDKIKPFTISEHNTLLNELIVDKSIDQANFYSKLNQILATLNQQIQQNIAENTRIKKFIEPYLVTEEEYQTEAQKAIISVLFKDDKTIRYLKEFTKNLNAWNRTLPIYHQLIKSSSPEDIEIINVQNGSIDFLVNIDFDVALNLTEVFKIGFRCFMAYLSYKKMAQPLIDSYFGNKKLIEGEKERETELINNIGEAVKNAIAEQHAKAAKKDKNIDANGVKRIDQVTKLIASHILKGNDYKLLSIPAETDTESNERNEKTKTKLRTVSSQVRQAMKIISPAEMKMLLEKYNEDEQ